MEDVFRLKSLFLNAPRLIFGRGLVHGRRFPSQKFVSKRPEAYFREGAYTWKEFSNSKVCF